MFYYVALALFANDRTVSLGKSSSTALERLYKQTVALTDLIAEDGGIGSLVNVPRLLRSVQLSPSYP